MYLIRYRIIQIVRQWSVMFWALVFPLILGTFFYIAFGRGDMGEDMEEIPVAVVLEEQGSVYTEAFLAFLEQMDGEILQVVQMGEKGAKEALLGDEVIGIFHCRRRPSLTVAGSGIGQSILKSLMDAYDKNEAMLTAIAQEHPESLPKAMEAMGQRQETTEDIGVKGKTLDPNITYFFALIAYACLSGAFLGVQSSLDSQADLSALGARRSVTPTHKFHLVLVDMVVLFFIHFIDLLILTCYIQFVLGVDLGSDAASIVLVEWMGSMIGICIGILVGCIKRLGVGAKMGVCVLFTLFPGFLAGLMFGQMKNVVEHHCPLVNRVNPAAVLSDAFYSISVYNDGERFIRSVGILGVMSVGMVLAAYLAVRRVRYDSI